MQDDILLPDLTVAETLEYAAALRLPPSFTLEERQKIVADVILELGLKDCMSTRIGNHVRKGCSGGEKRRTSLGVRLLSNPSVLYLDEVTTGLDARSALQLVRTLKELAAKGRTIIVTIHQPRSEIWALFDRLILLSDGNLIYSGLASHSIAYFDRLGYKLPDYVNPAEFLIDLTTIDTRRHDLEQISRTRVQGLRDAWRAAMQDRLVEGLSREKNGYGQSIGAELAKSFQPGFYRSVMVQTTRTTKITIRDPLGLVASLREAAILGIIAG